MYSKPASFQSMRLGMSSRRWTMLSPASETQVRWIVDIDEIILLCGFFVVIRLTSSCLIMKILCVSDQIQAYSVASNKVRAFIQGGAHGDMPKSDPSMNAMHLLDSQTFMMHVAYQRPWATPRTRAGRLAPSLRNTQGSSNIPGVPQPVEGY